MDRDHKGHLSREDVLKVAQNAVDSMGPELFHDGTLAIYFSCYCDKCGEKLVFEEPNVLHEFTMCGNCGNHQQVTHAGFMLSVGIGQKATDLMKEQFALTDEERKKHDQAN